MLTPRHIRRARQALLPPPSSSKRTIAFQLQSWAKRRPERPFLLYRDQAFSYAQANAAINRHAHAYRALGIGRGDVVALIMENRPEYLFHVYGLHKLGAVVSLINTHITGSVLLHAIRSCNPKCIVVGSEVWRAFASVQSELRELGDDAAYVDLDPIEGGLDLDRASRFDTLVASADASDPETSAQPHLGDLAAYIYTSGTTGLPKAAVIRHDRMFRAGAAWSSLAIAYRAHDVMYNCLPLYHANGFLLATGSVVSGGVTMALSRRFSRQRFWDEIREYRATSFIYIGELCRYLMSSEPSPRDREHSIRAITGNGLRPEIWRELQRRFGIRRVAEFYGATEGNVITVNIANVVGSVGPRLPGMVLARWSEAEQSFVRDENGRLMKARIGEPGILLGRIGTRSARRFDGYRDRKESETKILRDAFRQGDAWFNTGDLLKCDWRLHLSFTDRVGDTFRWKGENVATTEVQEQIAKWSDVAEVAVYGVQLPGIEGRAGMAALVLANGHPFDPAAFAAHVDSHLPTFARPLFVRLPRELEKTSTLKVKKNELQKQGFDPSAVADPIYFRRPGAPSYIPLDAPLYAELTSGKLRV